MLVLHIGTHKTGTSALQRFCTKNAAAIEQAGVRYLEAGRGDGLNHHKLAWAVKEGEDQTVWDDVRCELTAHPAAVHLISSEAFWFSDPTRVRAEIPDGVPLTIAVYLRRQDSYLQSLYKQAVVGGRKMTFDQWLTKFSFRGDYLAVVDRWAERFGAANILLRPYERDGERRDIAEDFLDFLGAGDAARAQPKKVRGNPSPRKELLELIRGFNHLGFKVTRDRLFFPVIKGRPDYVRSADLLNHEQASELLARYAESNRALVEKYYRDTATPLFPPLTVSAEPEAWDIDSEPYLGLTARFLENVLNLTVAGEIIKPEPKAKRPAA